MMDTFRQDFRYGIRTLLRNPGFTTIAVLTLALGLGANTAIFSLTDQILLRLLPVEKPEELVVLRSPGPKSGRVWSDGDSAASLSYPLYKELRDNNNVFSGSLARFAVALSVSGEGQTERANGELVSGNYFEVLGVRPALGRVLTQDDDQVAGAGQVVVLSHSYWSRRFGADPAILNKTLIVNGQLMTVVGVARAGFDGVQVGQKPDIFIPITMKAQMTPNWDGMTDHRDFWLAIIGRLKPGLSREQAEQALAPVYRQILEAELPLMGRFSTENKQRFLERPMLMDPGSRGRQIVQRDAKQPLLVLMGMVGLVLLIACANVANLLMARGAARQREIAIRMAVGAGRLRLVRQFLVESLTLSLIGGVAGLLVASWTISLLVSAIPDSIGMIGLSAKLDLRLLAFTLILSILTGLVFGLMPAIKATRLNLEGTLREQGSSVSGALSQVRFRKALVVSQVVLTTVLLVGAGLFARSLNNLKALNLGLRPDNLIAFSVAPALNGYSPERTIALFDQLQQNLSSQPGVDAVSAAVYPAFTDTNSSSNITVEGYQAGEDEDMDVRQNWIGPGYFSTMGIPLLSGRELSESDTSKSPKVAIINETMKQRFFADRDPVGLRFAFGSGDKVQPDIQIVGVVKDSKHSTVRDKAGPFVYLPYSQFKTLGNITFYLKTKQDVAATTLSLRREAQRLDANLPVFDLKTMERQIDESLFNDKFLTLLSMCFALLAALLASIGLYGVMAYTVTRRTREIGIRMALGATRGIVSWLILREVVVLALVGLVVGLPAAYGLGRLTESLLFGVKAGDPLVFVGAGLLLTGATLLGGYIPARKAAGIDPLVALRCE
ncbi:MAG TPA: ABC transporter permease [Blastocatellia bacterium]|nr:ABC transporter permease [Blastocatellia bacterium]